MPHAGEIELTHQMTSLHHMVMLVDMPLSMELRSKSHLYCLMILTIPILLWDIPHVCSFLYHIFVIPDSEIS